MLHMYTEYVDSSNHHLIAISENWNTYYLVQDNIGTHLTNLSDELFVYSRNWQLSL